MLARLASLSFRSLLLSLLIGTPSEASWPGAGKPVSQELGSEGLVSLQTDGQGGCYVLATRPSISGATLFRFSPDGEAAPGWQTSGLAIASFLSPGAMVADGSGGVFVVWLQNGEARATRLDASGTFSGGWSPDGNVVVSAPPPPPISLGRNLYGAMADGAGGLIVYVRESNCVYWEEHTGRCVTYGNNDRLQRVLGDGALAPGWSATGHGWGTDVVFLGGHRLVARAAGSTMTIWPDDYGGVNLKGIGAATEGLFQRWVQVTPYFRTFQGATDLNGGAYLAWKGFVEPGIEVLRVGSDGLPAPGWPPGGVLIPSTDLLGSALQPVSDGSGYVLWNNLSSDPTEARAARFGPDGSRGSEWPESGLTLAAPEWLLTGASSGDGGTGLIAGLNGPGGLYAQHILADASFDSEWGTNGIAPLAVASGAKQGLQLIEDGSGGLFGAWLDHRDPATAPDLYVHHLDSHGMPYPTPADVPPPAGGTAEAWLRVRPRSNAVEVEYELPSAADVRLVAYDLAGRHVVDLQRGSRPAGVHHVDWERNGLASGVYFLRLSYGDRELVQRVVMRP